MSQETKVLFVCLGNICRSPMAEAVFQRKIEEANLENQFVVDSAATSTWEHGNPTHPGTIKVLKQNGIKGYQHHSRHVTDKDFAFFDYIIGMDEQNVEDLLRMAPNDEARKKVVLFLSIAPESAYTGVPDPYYTGNFEETYTLVDDGVNYWTEKMLEQ
jgi:protein-tyrosine phosphatase